MRDDLLQPTIRSQGGSGEPPWRLMSQGYVAFFGGTIAGTTIALLNAGRLGIDARRRAWILATGVIALLVALAAVIWAVRAGYEQSLRPVTRVPAIVAYLVQARLMRPMDRAFELRGGDHASLWKPGLAAVFGCGLIEGLLVLILSGMVA